MLGKHDHFLLTLAVPCARERDWKAQGAGRTLLKPSPEFFCLWPQPEET